MKTTLKNEKYYEKYYSQIKSKIIVENMTSSTHNEIEKMLMLTVAPDFCVKVYREMIGNMGALR